MKKINFCLPNFYENLKINLFFKDLKKEWLKFPVNFFCFTGNFPSCYWNGQYNSMGKYIDYEIISNFSQNNRIALKIDCNNISCEEEQYDTLGNIILDKCQTGANLIECNSIQVFNYFKEKYPYYNFVYNLINCDNQNIDINNFRYIKISNYYNIENKIEPEKIIIKLNSSCGFYNCPIREKCDNNLKQSIKNYSCLDPRSDCSLVRKYGDDIKFSDIEIYIRNGVNHFELAPALNKKDYIDFLIKFFIKEEKQLEIKKIMLEEGIIND